METRQLGRSELRIPLVVFGAWAIGGWYWGKSDDDEAVRAIQASIDAGANAIDTAPVYGFGHSERVVGRAIKGRRQNVIVMTKVGLRWDDERGDVHLETVDQDGARRVVRFNSRPWSVKQEVEQSLARMSIDVIDLIQVHRNDPKTPVAETMGALLELKKAGKVRAIGVSNFDVDLLQESQRALGDVPLASDQPKYSLVARGIESAILPHCRTNDVGVIVYSPLEQGLLTGKVGAERVFGPGEGREKRPTFRASNRTLVNAALDRTVRPIAERHRATMAQIVIAWTIAQPGVTAAIVGARTVEQARENAAAAEVKLEAAEIASIRAEFAALKLDVPGPAASGLKQLVKKILGR